MNASHLSSIARRPRETVLTRRRLLGTGLVAGGALALGGRSLGPVWAYQAASPKAGGSMAVGLTVFNAPEDFDPVVLAPNTASPYLIMHLYERLLRLGADGSSVEPGLAESWDVSPDGLVYTFHLRDARFHDGSAVTADDVVWSLQRMLDNPGVANQMAVFTAETPDERTVVFRLDRPYAPFAVSLALSFASILPKALVETQKRLFFEQPIGSGPFRFGSWDGSGELVLTRNADYWETGRPYLDELRFLVTPTVDDTLAQFASGAVDLLPTVAISQLSAVRDIPNAVVEVLPTFSTVGIAINLSRPPFDDRNLRLAMNYAIDRPTIVADAFGGIGTPAISYIPPTLPGHDPALPGFPQDLDKARALVAQSAAKDGFSAELIAFPNDPAGLAASHLVAASLEQIGGKVTVLADPNLDIGARLGTNRYDLILTGGHSWNGDPDSITRFMVHSVATGDGLLTHYRNAQVDVLADAAVAMTDETERMEAYAQIQALVNDDPNWLFLVYPPNVVAHTEQIHDAVIQPQPQPSGYARLWDTWRDDV